MEVAAPHYRGCGRPIATEIAGKVIALKLRAAKIAVLQRHAMHLAALDLGKAEVTGGGVLKLAPLQTHPWGTPIMPRWYPQLERHTVLHFGWARWTQALKLLWPPDHVG